MKTGSLSPRRPSLKPVMTGTDSRPSFQYQKNDYSIRNEMMLSHAQQEDENMNLSSIRQAIDEQAAERATRLGMERDVLPSLPSMQKFATILMAKNLAGIPTLLNQWTDRHVGKTVSIHFDDLRLSTFAPGDFRLLFEVVKERNAETLVLDEVQDIQEWERFC